MDIGPSSDKVAKSFDLHKLNPDSWIEVECAVLLQSLRGQFSIARNVRQLDAGNDWDLARLNHHLDGCPTEWNCARMRFG